MYMYAMSIGVIVQSRIVKMESPSQQLEQWKFGIARDSVRFLVKTPYEFAEFFQTKFRIQLDRIKKTRQLLKALLTSVCAIHFCWNCGIEPYKDLWYRNFKIAVNFSS
jgi:hypothetical protein